MTISRGIACKRLSAVGALHQSEVNAVLNTIEKWKAEEGAEHTVKRLKSIKTAFIQYLSGAKVEVPWVKHTDKYVKGPFKPFFRDISNPKRVQRALSSLMVYSADSAVEVTPTQNKKFWDSVEAKTSPEHIMNSERLVDYFSFSWYTTTEVITKPRVLDTLYSRRGPKPSGLGSQDYDPTDLQMVSHPIIRKAAVLAYTDLRSLSGPYVPNQKMVAGRIGYIQEAGFKLRAIANPVPYYNWVLQPLKQGLLDILANMESDCTHDQMKGVVWAQKKLLDGCTLASVDLSDATNLFPLSIQMAILKTLCRSELARVQAEAFELLATADWYDPLTGTYRRWLKGQPLGLGPSFPLFAYSHHQIMEYILLENRKLFTQDELNNYKMGDKPWRILGDDIVMDNRLSESYFKLMSSIGCKISMDKTIISPRLAEFASRIITADNIYIQNKWRDMSDRNFLDLVKNLGPQSIGLCRPRQKKIIKILSELPEFMGGLGWNPKGKPIDTRIKEGELVLDLLSSEQGDTYRKVVPNRFDPFFTTPSLQSKCVSPNIEPKVLIDGLSIFELAVRETWQRRREADQASLQDTLTPCERVINYPMHQIVSDTKPTGFVPEQQEIADPRGKTTLEVHERKLKPLLSTKHDLSR